MIRKCQALIESDGYEELSRNKSHLPSIGLTLEYLRWGGGATVLGRLEKGMIQVSIDMFSVVAPRLCTGEAFCQLLSRFCPILASWSWSGRIFPEGKQPTPSPTLLLGQLFARQKSHQRFLLAAHGTSCEITGSYGL